MPGGLTRSIIVAAMVLNAVTLSSCKDSGSEPPKAVEATPINPATAGSISVNVRYNGAVPAAVPINMASTPACAKLHGEPVVDRSVVVSGGNLADSVVYIKSGLEGWVLAPPSQTVVLDQKGCLYEPRVAAAMVGQAVEFQNSDAESHNVHGKPEVLSGWNFMMSRQGQTRTFYFDKPETGIPVGCDIHPWMRAFLCILPNPYFGITNKEGQVLLKNIPPGRYTLAVWHEALGEQEQVVDLPSRGELAVGFGYQGK